MDFKSFVSLNNEIQYLYFFNKTCQWKSISTQFQDIGLNLKKQIIKSLEEHLIWKEYDYCLYINILKDAKDLANINCASLHILNALSTNNKEVVMRAMHLLKILETKIDLSMLMKNYFYVQGDKPPDMSYYAYFLPTIQSVYGNKGLDIVQENCSKKYALLYKLHAMKLYKRQTMSDFIISLQETGDLSIYKNHDLIGLLFEVICKRREKVLAYEQPEIDFIINNITGVDSSLLSFLKYFMSHLCITQNQHKSKDFAPFHQILNKSLVLLAEKDATKVKRGAVLYSAFYKSVIRSEYRTLYTLMKKDIHEEKKSFVYLSLVEEDNCNKNLQMLIGSDDHLKFIISLINDTNFHHFEEILGFYDCTTVLTKETFEKFFGELEGDYLEDKIKGLICLLVRNWYKDESNRRILIEENILQIETNIKSLRMNYDLYKSIKLVDVLINNICLEDILKLEECMKNAMDAIIENELLIGEQSKLNERILIAALDLLLKFSSKLVGSKDNQEDVVLTNLKYIEKGIFCNKRYAASASGHLYCRYITTKFSAHRTTFLNYMNSIVYSPKNFDATASKMRRCLEKRIIIQEFCLALNREDQKVVVAMICRFYLQEINSILYSSTYEERKSTDLKSLIFCVNALMTDTSMKQSTKDFNVECLDICFVAIDLFSNDFAICNAIYTLYATVVQRILPYHDSTKNGTLGNLVTYLKCSQKLTDIIHNFKLEHNKKSSFLLCLLLQRTNSETAFEKCDLCLRILDYLYQYFTNSDASKLCGFEADCAIQLWLNLTRYDTVKSVITTVQNMTYETNKNESQLSPLNFLNVKFKLLEGLSTKVNYLNKQQLLLEAFQLGVPIEQIGKFNDKMRVSLPQSLKQFPLKELTMKPSLCRILSEITPFYEKITAFEFFYNHLQYNNKLDLFIKIFLNRYIITLFKEVQTSGRKLDTFVMSLNTIVRCLDKSPKIFAININNSFVFSDFIGNKNSELVIKPSFLAFVTFLYNLHDFGDESNRILKILVRNYQRLSENIDDMEVADAESILIMFKYLKPIKLMTWAETNWMKIEIFLIALKLLHSILLSECDYLLLHVLDALNVDYSGFTLTIIAVKGFVLSKEFLLKYFKCKHSLLKGCLLYIDWIHKKKKICS